MLLIRPFLKVNALRFSKSHLPVFFIFIVSNLGGLLTPLGDPPLFLGFLRGVDFFWTLNLWKHWLVGVGIVTAIFFIWDAIALKREPKHEMENVPGAGPLRLLGTHNFVFLAGILAVILLLSPEISAAVGLPPQGEIAARILGKATPADNNTPLDIGVVKAATVRSADVPDFGPVDVDDREAIAEGQRFLLGRHHRSRRALFWNLHHHGARVGPPRNRWRPAGRQRGVAVFLGRRSTLIVPRQRSHLCELRHARGRRQQLRAL